MHYISELQSKRGKCDNENRTETFRFTQNEIYIYKNECLYVCLSRMRSYTIHPIAMKLRSVVVRTPGKVYELLFSS
jgi:hypothetical protein